MKVVFDPITKLFSVTKLDKVHILYRRWSTKNGNQLNEIPKFWDIVENYIDSKNLKGYGTDWTNDDFLYGIVFDGDVPSKVISEVKKKYPDIKLDNSYEIPSQYDVIYKGDLSEMGKMYEDIWSKGNLSHELEEYPEKNKCVIKAIYENNI